MILFLTIVLVASCIAMVALLWVKHWELSTGRVIFSQSRPRIGQFFERLLFAIERHLPILVRRYWQQFLVWLRVNARGAIARGLLATERSLEHALQTLRQKTQPPPREKTGSASAFLREVAEHKKRLAHKARAKRDIEP